MAYRFLDKYQKQFELRRLLRHLHLCPNTYYNYRKKRKAQYHAVKEKTLAPIKQIYHEHDGVDGYRSMRVFLERKHIQLSKATVHRYMNQKLTLYSITQKKFPSYRKEKAHKVFKNLLIPIHTNYLYKYEFLSNSILLPPGLFSGVIVSFLFF